MTTKKTPTANNTHRRRHSLSQSGGARKISSGSSNSKNNKDLLAMPSLLSSSSSAAARAGGKSNTGKMCRTKFMFVLWPAAAALLLASWNTIDPTRVIRQADITINDDEYYADQPSNMFNSYYAQHHSHNHRVGSSPSLVLFPTASSVSTHDHHSGRVIPPSQAVAEMDSPGAQPNYRGLIIRPVIADNFARIVMDDNVDNTLYNQMRNETLTFMDTNIEDVDDIDSKDPMRYEPYDEQKYPSDNGCYRLKWHCDVVKRKSCNEFHTITIDRLVGDDQAFGIRYLGRGHFRQIWQLSAHHIIGSDAVLKTNRIYEHRGYNNYAFSQTANEALAMLQTHSSNRTMNIYGYCGTSILVEPGDDIQDRITDYKWMSQEELDKQQLAAGDVVPQNNLTLEEKLDIAISMAEGLALLHGNEEGMVISHDVGYDQWLVSKKDGLVKLNDFNKARPMHWNPTRKEYCKVWSSQYDSYRAPEEVHGGYIDGSADVNAYGKFLYTLMTGLRVFYSIPRPHRGKKSIDSVYGNKQPYIDPRYRTRSLVEGRFVEIIEKCNKHNASERVDIFTVVSHLRETARLAKMNTKG